MNRETILLTAMLVFFTSSHNAISANTHVAKLTGKEVNALLESKTLIHVRSKFEIPKIWWNSMELYNMSDVNGPFESGCSGSGPHRRILSAAINASFATVLFEEGGEAHTYALIVCKNQNGVVYRTFYDFIAVEKVATILKQLGR